MSSILIVDDDCEAAALLTGVLQTAGHEVRHARNGNEALRLIREKCPHLLLLDVEMPVLDGPSLARKIASREDAKRRIPVLLVSAVEDLAAIAGELGTPHFVRKPFCPSDILRAVSRALCSSTDLRPHRRHERATKEL